MTHTLIGTHATPLAIPEDKMLDVIHLIRLCRGCTQVNRHRMVYHPAAVTDDNGRDYQEEYDLVHRIVTGREP